MELLYLFSIGMMAFIVFYINLIIMAFVVGISNKNEFEKGGMIFVLLSVFELLLIYYKFNGIFDNFLVDYSLILMICICLGCSDR